MGEEVDTKPTNGDSNGKTNECPAAKKIKTKDIDLTDLISDHILKEADTMKSNYSEAKPYPHAVLKNLFKEADFLKKVIEEIKDNSKVNFKESDLFRVYQSIDLANLSDDDDKEKLPHTLQLRKLLYSEAWRSFMERVAGLEEGTLSTKIDCACNCHAPGCHLLCHDDVIGTRKLSYILYLTDPEPEWTSEEGGALELYDSIEGADAEKKQRVPEASPCQTVLPLFNHMAFFKVDPGFSFHSIQEVLGDRPRLSLQGWYHAEKPPENIEHATLQQLKSTANKTEGEKTKYESYPGEEKGDEEKKTEGDEDHLSEADRTYLLKYMDATYLLPEAIKEMRECFEDQSSIQLRSVLNKTWLEKINKACEAVEGDKKRLAITDPNYYKQGVGEEWKLVGPPHMQRFLEYSKSGEKSGDVDEASPGALLNQLRTDLLQSLPFRRYLNLITSLGEATGYRGTTRRFRRGLDYTVAHHGLLSEESVLDATLCFCAGIGEEAAVAVKVVEEDFDAEEEGKEEGDKKEKTTKDVTKAVLTVATKKDVEDDEEDGEKKDTEDDGKEPDPADVAWQSGDVGGFECYISAVDEDEGEEEKEGDDEKEAKKKENASTSEPAEAYDENDDTELLSVNASNNTLSLVYRDPGTMRFIKYVSSTAPSSRWDIAMEYQVPQEDEDEGDDKEMKE